MTARRLAFHGDGDRRVAFCRALGGFFIPKWVPLLGEMGVKVVDTAIIEGINLAVGEDVASEQITVGPTGAAIITVVAFGGTPFFYRL